MVPVPRNVLQNGPDGITLVDAQGQVVQFLSYEGTFLAMDGPAQGLQSTDIVVKEDSATNERASLQLTGTGKRYQEFTWLVAVANTFGQPNLRQRFTVDAGTCIDEDTTPPLVSIPNIQGDGRISPLVGTVATIRGVVVGTCCPDIPTAKQAVEYVAALAEAAGFTPKILLGSDATVANYKYYLKRGVFGFVNAGHGYPGGIILDDGRLRSTWFAGLINRPLSPAVVYFNSCQVHNEPLLPAIMAAGARTYIGGIVNLLIGPSEAVCKCFWKKILIQGNSMGKTLTKCEARNSPNKGDHGLSGDKGKFRAGHIIVFEHANFRGHHRHIFGMEKNLNHPEDNSLNDKISSFIVLSGHWRFYRHHNYTAPLGGNYGPGEYRWVEAVGIKNDDVSSLRSIHS